jgi:hypothetical protein
MILCPNCLNKEMTGAVFCSECGAQLFFETDGLATDIMSPLPKISSADLQSPRPGDKASAFSGNGDNLPEDCDLGFSPLASGEFIPVCGRAEVTLGRVSEGQAVVPDIDLTPYRAYESGVSRMHVSIRFEGEEVVLTDLGSANGTRVNGKQVPANESCPLKHGDILTLGKFKLKVILRNH